MILQLMICSIQLNTLLNTFEWSLEYTVASNLYFYNSCDLICKEKNWYYTCNASFVWSMK